MGLLDNERADVWAQLALVHLRLDNLQAADTSFRQCLAHNPACDELLLEVSAEYSRRQHQPDFAVAAARTALQIRDSGEKRRSRFGTPSCIENVGRCARSA